MLRTLRIENFVIVKVLELNFLSGMTTFTGETGAGKSIMIDALELALGTRADSSVIRAGAETCDVAAIFHFDDNSPPAKWLEDQDIPYENNEVILRRVLSVEGRSKSYINGQLFPLQKIKELSEMLVHIHGQHQHQTLLHHSTHRQQLDSYAGHGMLVAEVQGLFANCQNIKYELEALKEEELQKDRRLLLEFQIEELDSLDLKPGEMQALSLEHQELQHAQEHIEQSQNIANLLNGDNEDFTVCQVLNRLELLLSQLPKANQAIQTLSELISSSLINCEEAYSEIQKFAEKLRSDPKRLQEVDARLSILHQASRKYHRDIDSLLAHREDLVKELAKLSSNASLKQELQQKYQLEIAAYEKAALTLRKSRQTWAAKLATEITAIIQLLGMPKGSISIEIQALDKMHNHGMDKVEYMVCTNPGSPLDTLSRVASGGELSRISLAIQMITARRGATPTLIFDEVDVGIGGPTAALVGKLLRQLGERLQVFAVTHQPQVASFAHNHFVVSKCSDSKETMAKIEALTASSKISEIARMLGGINITPQSLSHAKELVDQSQL